MSGRQTKRKSSKISPDLGAIEVLEEEAKNFTKDKTTKKSSVPKEKPLTPRQHLAGIILSGLLARSQGMVNMADLRQEAFDLADTLLEYE